MPTSKFVKSSIGLASTVLGWPLPSPLPALSTSSYIRAARSYPGAQEGGASPSPKYRNRLLLRGSYRRVAIRLLLENTNRSVHSL
jgi:hypothetical protein